MHPREGVVSLPRSVVGDYTRPYFEGRVRSLRVVWGERAGAGAGPHSGKIRKGKEGSGSDGPGTGGKTKGKGKQKDNANLNSNSKPKTQLEWKDRWVVIHQDMLNLCKYRMVRIPSGFNIISYCIECT
jgi:hypothetical protein